MKEVIEYILADMEQSDSEHFMIQKQHFTYLKLKAHKKWEVTTPLFHSDYQMIDSEYMDYSCFPPLYAAFALKEEYKIKAGNPDKCTIDSKTEMRRVMAETNRCSMQSAQESFLPIAVNESGYLIFEVNGEQINIQNTQPMQWIKYRIPKGNISISSEKPFRVGTAIPMGHHPERKRLVLNIFIDGLSQMVLQEDFSALMPNTYRFFSKGMICSNAYTTGDWTFPSIASIVTGQTMAKHKMLHSKLLRKIDEDTPILFEYFNNAGYNTTKIGGNWRITPNYGYARGMDAVFYQHHCNGYHAETVVSEVIEQMYSMRETDQFIWMEIGELHMIADGLELGSNISEFPLWKNQEERKGINSVKQEYNPMLIRYYRKQMERVDRKLASLYQYIEEMYADDEILVSLFSDHGQGYLVKPEEEFLSQGRSRVAFMVRGNGLKGKTEEVISTCDYTPIMCSLAGIPFLYDNTDAHLPAAFGGTAEREFAITESIHVGDPYQISLKGKDFTFYFISEENVTSECRIPLKNYKVWLEDSNGNKIEDAVRENYYTKYCLKHIGSCVIFDN